AWTTTEAPNSGVNIKRLEREWRFSEINGDVGNVDLTIDVSTFPALPAGFSSYGIMIDSDGDFSSGTDVYEVALVSGTRYSVSGINIADGGFVSICAIDPKVSFTNDASDDFETNTSASMSIELNYIPKNNVTVEYTTADGSASSAQDYTAVSGATATISAGSSSANITIAITDDAAVETDETLTITLSAPSSGVDLGTTTVHTYTIHDDDDARKIYFDVNASSAAESTSPITVNVSMSSTSATDVSVDYSLNGGTATEGVGNDFVLSSGTVTITGGSGLTTGSFTFSVNDDVIYEGDETIKIKLSNPVGCNIDLPAPDNDGTGFSNYTYTINDNEITPEIQFTTTSGSGLESVSPVNISVEINKTSSIDVSVNYIVANISAINGSDYSLASGTVIIPPGSTSKNIVATIINDGIEELTESFKLTLSSPTNATIGANNVYTYTIDDNDLIGYKGAGGVGKSSNNKLWLCADDISQSDGTSVTSWTDRSGNSNNASQAAAANKPIYKTSIVNGHGVVRFDGTDDYFDDNHSY
ncbi:MAG: hypothetical protein KAH32_01005, partial [Chlamydiia bacterium]|nr:hypothetical protein [Chlamydiia bacterium]